MKSLRRLLVFGLAAILASLWAASPVDAQGKKFWSIVRDERGQPITSGVTCQVYAAGTDTRVMVHGNVGLTTAQVNPWSANSSGECVWWHSATTAVDFVAWHKNGRAFFPSFSQSDHSTVLDTQGFQKVIRIPFGNSRGSKVQTGVTIPKGFLVNSVLIEVVAAVADAHIAIGIDATESGGNDDGFCAGGETKVGDLATGGKSLESAGWHHCHAVTIQSSGTWVGDYYIAAFHSGRFLSRGAIGTNTYTGGTNGCAVCPHAGSYLRQGWLGNGTAKTVVYTTNDKAVGGHFYILGIDSGIR